MAIAMVSATGVLKDKQGQIFYMLCYVLQEDSKGNLQWLCFAYDGNKGEIRKFYRDEVFVV